MKKLFKRFYDYLETIMEPSEIVLNFIALIIIAIMIVINKQVIHLICVIGF